LVRASSFVIAGNAIYSPLNTDALLAEPRQWY